MKCFGYVLYIKYDVMLNGDVQNKIVLIIFRKKKKNFWHNFRPKNIFLSISIPIKKKIVHITIKTFAVISQNIKLHKYTATTYQIFNNFSWRRIVQSLFFFLCSFTYYMCNTILYLYLLYSKSINEVSQNVIR